MQMKVKADFAAYTRDLEKKLAGDEFRMAIARGFSDTVIEAQDKARAYTRKVFALHTEWVPRGIMAIPSTSAQRNATVRSMATHGDFIAAVYFRNAQDPRRSYSFIDDHAVGRTRKAHKSALAIPSALTVSYGHKTSRGAVKRRWKPSTLLADMQASGAKYDGVTTRAKKGKHGKSKGTPKPFKVFSRRLGATVIARRKDHRAYPLEVLYVFRDEATIPQKYGFEKEVWKVVGDALLPALRKHVEELGRS